MQLAWAGIKKWARGPEPGDVMGEAGQARLRVIGGGAAWCGFALLHLLGPFGPFDKVLPLLALYVLGSVGWYAVVMQRLGGQRLRLLLAIVLEQGIYAHLLVVAGAQAALLLWLPMFSSLGYGLRFGPRLAMFSAAVAVGLLSWRLNSSPYWQAMPEVCAGLLLASVAVPVYGSMLSRRLLRTRLDAEQRAAAWEVASKTDPLTGLANRVALMEALERVFGTQRQAARVCALFYVDLDGFKAVNDQAGHPAGDQVLTEVACALREAVRADDVVARLGGDEFAILTYGLALSDDAMVVADKVLGALGQIVVPHFAHLHIGCSIGVCLLPADDIASPHEAVRLADELMLAVKRAGKGAARLHRDGRDRAQSSR